MFRRVAANGDAVHFVFDGRPMVAAANDTVAQALFVNGVKACRDTVVSGAPRGPYCLMGVCFDCLVEIDGIQNRQACQVVVRAGMTVEIQKRGRSLTEGAAE